MGIGSSIFLVAVGAILAFAVHITNHSGIDIQTIGWILIIVGAVGVLLSLVFWGSWGGFNTGGRTRTVVRGQGRTVVEDRDVYRDI